MVIFRSGISNRILFTSKCKEKDGFRSKLSSIHNRLNYRNIKLAEES